MSRNDHDYESRTSEEAARWCREHDSHDPRDPDNHHDEYDAKENPCNTEDGCGNPYCWKCGVCSPNDF